MMIASQSPVGYYSPLGPQVWVAFAIGITGWVAVECLSRKSRRAYLGTLWALVVVCALLPYISYYRWPLLGYQFWDLGQRSLLFSGQGISHYLAPCYMANNVFVAFGVLFSWKLLRDQETFSACLGIVAVSAFALTAVLDFVRYAQRAYWVPDGAIAGAALGAIGVMTLLLSHRLCDMAVRLSYILTGCTPSESDPRRRLWYFRLAGGILVGVGALCALFI
jgi:hypothetical protein